MKRAFAWLLVAVLGFSIWAMRSARGPAAPAVPESPRPQSEGHSRADSQAETRAAPGSAVRPDRPAPDRRWHDFRLRFGEELEADFLGSGQLARVRNPGGARPAAPDFRAGDPQKAIARAREVLDGVKDLLGIENQSPLSGPIFRGGDSAAHVSFQQTFEGLPVEPLGNVTVDLGRDGQLNGLYSTYVLDVQVSNAQKLTADEARTNAQAAFAGTPEGAVRAEGGNAVIWVPHAGAGARAEGRRAYEYSVQGHQVVVDAQTGDVLYNRDRRQFQ